jgi:hypothetical protein
MINMVQPYDADGRFDLPLSEITSELIQQFHRHWLQMCSAGRLPSRAHIEPSNLKRILPNVILVDIERNPFRVRYRLCGTRVTEFCGQLTGRYLDEVGANNVWSAAAHLRQYETAAIETRPVFISDRTTGRSGVCHPSQTGIWPLASEGREVDLCIAVEDYLRIRRADLQPALPLQAY